MFPYESDLKPHVELLIIYVEEKEPSLQLK